MAQEWQGQAVSAIPGPLAWKLFHTGLYLFPAPGNKAMPSHGLKTYQEEGDR
jgi:hypothetical protein